MNQWHFVIAAYGLFVVATGGLLLWSWMAMRAAEDEGK